MVRMVWIDGHLYTEEEAKFVQWAKADTEARMRRDLEETERASLVQKRWRDQFVREADQLRREREQELERASRLARQVRQVGYGVVMTSGNPGNPGNPSGQDRRRPWWERWFGVK